MRAWDLTVLRRTVTLAGVLAALSLAVQVATDEPGATAAHRVARFAAFLPLVAAVAVVLVRRQAGQRLELDALAGLGVPPARATASAFGVALGAVLCAGLLLGSPLSDPGALLPRLDAPAWHWRTERFEDSRGGAVVLGGELRATARPPPASSAPTLRGPVLLCLLPLGVCLVAWAWTAPLRPASLLPAVTAGVSATVLLHLAAVGGGVAALPLACLPLGLGLVRIAWKARDSRREGSVATRAH